MNANEHETKLGCTLKVARAEHVGMEHLGDGVLLRGQMRQPGDGRTFELYLSQEDLRWLVRRLSKLTNKDKEQT